MYEKKLSYKSIILQINYLALLLFVFWLPLKENYLPTIIIVWIATWLMEGNLKAKFTNIPHKYLFIGLLTYFSFHVLFLFRANDFDYGLFQIQKKLSVVLFPIILVGSNDKIKNNYINILKVFVLGVVTASLFCLYNSFETSYVMVDGKPIFKTYIYDEFKDFSFFETVTLRHNYFSSKFLSIFKHHAYFSMYIIFAIVIIVDLFRKKIIKTRAEIIFYIFVIVLLLGMLFLLQSRSAFVAIPILIICMAIIEFRKKINIVSIGIFASILGIAVFLLSTSDKLQQNIEELRHISQEGLVANINKHDQRYRIWYSSILVIKENFWIGTSPANLVDELVEKYEELGFESEKQERLNSHNQYLETFAGIGVFGLLSLIFIIAYSFAISIKQRHYLLFFLMLLLSINFLFEAMLSRMAGVLFMMLFLSIFISQSSMRNEELTMRNEQ